MKNRLNLMWNLPIKNPTQTDYLRFRLGPRGELKSGFTDAVEAFDKAMKRDKTVYERYIGEF